MSNKTPFIAFDTFALRDLIIRLTDNELRLYMLLCTYANGITSLLWPGIDELSGRSGIAPATVHRTLDRMAAKGLIAFIRRDYKDPVTGQSQPNVYQICGPFLPANSIKADSTVKHEKGTTTIINNNQEQQSVKNNQEPPPPPTTERASRQHLRERADSTSAFEPLPTELSNRKDKSKGQRPEHQQGQNAAQPTQNQEREQKLSSPGSAAPSSLPKRDLTPYQSPLADMARERLAARIAAECDTTTPVARETADKFDPGAVEAALSEMSSQAAVGGIKKSKYGFVLWHLRNGAIAQPDIAKAQRRAALAQITAPGVFHKDHETGEVCTFIGRSGTQLMMQSEAGQHFTLSIDDAIRVYGYAAPAATGD